MLDIKFIRENPEKVKEGIQLKNLDPKIIDKFLQLDEEWCSNVSAIDHLRSEQNLITTQLKKDNQAGDLVNRAQILKKQLAVLEKSRLTLEKRREEILYLLPNLPLPEVPKGKSEKENVVLRQVGKKPKFSFTPLDYLTIAEKLNIIDVRRASKVSGSRFGYFLGGAVLLEFALIQYVIKLLTDEKFIAGLIEKNKLNLKTIPFIPVAPPVLINKESMRAMGYLDRGADDIYFLEKDGLYLVGTAEQSIGPMHQNEVFEESDLPKRYIGFSVSFRREAGSYGKDTKGILRTHQFNKLEMFSFTNPETSKEEHRLFLAIEERIMSDLKIPYQVLDICGGDLGDAAAAKFDIEAWMPGQNNGQGMYRETHSASNTTDWQARRLNIKYRPANQFVHLVNGTAAAAGRTIIAIIENYQTAGGAIKIPRVLQKFIPQFKEITPVK